MPYGEVYTGAQDRARRRRGEQLALLRVLAPFRGREVLRDHRALARAGDPAVLEEDLDTLGKDDQLVIKQAAKESGAFMRKLWDEREQQSRKIVEDGGAQIVAVQKKPFQDAMKPVYDKFITIPA